jgi:hypothetical protein
MPASTLHAVMLCSRQPLMWQVWSLLPKVGLQKQRYTINVGLSNSARIPNASFQKPLPFFQKPLPFCFSRPLLGDPHRTVAVTQH